MALHRGNVLLQAEPGAGKSTVLPLSFLDSGSSFGKVYMLEPRRLAARNVAERLAAQLGEPLGQRVGLRMRGHTSVSSNTQLEVVTEGVLTRLLQSDPLLEGTDLIIFDEFHERSLHADLGLALCLDVQRELRDDLRLLLMSATLDTSSLSQHLGRSELISCAVRQYPVELKWMGECRDRLPVKMAEVITTALNEHSGDVLVFLPGVAEIEKTATLLISRLPEKIKIHRLHAGVSSAAQRAATAPAAAAFRRVILSTSIAETSITIHGVSVVIDSGLERRDRQDAVTGAPRLETVMASQASAVQRSGRAGRTAPGVCYRLWNESGHSRRPASWQAEILRADLAPMLLELGQWGAASVDDLQWLDPPPEASLARAADLLTRFGIWSEGRLTEYGRAVARLPVHPRLAHLLLWASQRGAGDTACKLVALLEDNTRHAEQSDLELSLQSPLGSQQLRRVNQLKSLLPRQDSSQERLPPAVLIAQAWPDWIAQRRSGRDARFVLSCGAGALMHSDHPLSNCKWLAVAQLGGAAQQVRIFSASELDIQALENYAPGLFSVQRFLDWNDRTERVIAEERQMLGSLVVRSRPLDNVSNADRATALLAGIRRQGLSCLPWNDACREWQARVQRVLDLPDNIRQFEWPAVDDLSLLESLEQWLLPWIDGISSLKALSQLDLLSILNSLLDYPRQRLLDELLPVRYKVPSGSAVKLSYAVPGNPVLSVKLQEMFGSLDNPSIAHGAIPLKVELLSPARRPVQVTEDLGNFWINSYPAVKKDLAGRYPKHPWPDNPLEAQATARAKPRKKP